MKLQLLPSTFDEKGTATGQQHFACFIIDDRVAIDAGSLAMASSPLQKKQVRDIILTHAHIDHIAGLPLFIDDLFASIVKPVEVYATKEIIEILETHIFNWKVYPRFSELKNEFGTVLIYRPFEVGNFFQVEHLQVKAIGVNHKVPAVGFIVKDSEKKFGFTGDTAEMKEFWQQINKEVELDALFIECAFPNRLKDLAEVSRHLTPDRLVKELKKFKIKNCPIYIKNIKPMYHLEIKDELEILGIPNLKILEVGKIYDI
jgi:cAMP phosphodiesterase